MTREEAEACLGSRGWLASSPAEIKQAVLSRCTLQDVARGQSVCEIGKPPSGLWGIATGGFALEFATDEHGPHLAHAFRPGMWFGEAEAFAKRPQFVTIRATRPSTCLHLAPSALEAVGRDHPVFWRYLGALAGAHVGDALGAISDNSIRDPAARIAAILLRLAGVRVHEHLSDREPELDLTQDDLALLANLSRASVNEHLASFESQALVKRAYGRIHITDTEGLRAWIG